MKYTERLEHEKPHYIVITGDGLFDRRIIRGFCKKYRNDDILIWIPSEGHLKKTGISSLDALKVIPGTYKINSIICILDGDSFKKTPKRVVQIKSHLDSIAINIDKIERIKDSYLIQCSYANYKFLLYLIISGPETFIEENIIHLLKLMNIGNIQITGQRNKEWKRRVKRDVLKLLRNNNIKLDQFIPTISDEKLKASFPGMSNIFERIKNQADKSFKI